jgi:hypothetical protein
MNKHKAVLYVIGSGIIWGFYLLLLAVTTAWAQHDAGTNAFFLRNYLHDPLAYASFSVSDQATWAG